MIMSNGFNDIEEFEQKRETSKNITLILQGVKDLQEEVKKLKEGQKQIREDFRNIDKLKALKK